MHAQQLTGKKEAYERAFRRNYVAIFMSIFAP